MKHNIEYQGKSYPLESHSEGGQIIVEYEGERYVVTDQSAMSLPPTAPPVSVAPTPSAQFSAPSPPSSAPTASKGLVAAPMNGVIKKIHVTPSQSVAPQELLISMEAMKMEIDVSAPQGGTVATIHVAEGGTVEQGDQLITLT